MERQHKNPTGLEVFCNTIQMGERRFFGFEVSKGIDRIDGRIKGLIELEVRHVADDRIALDSQLFELLFAVL